MARKTSQCAVTNGEVDLAAYAAKDAEWREIGLAAPARRALIDAGILKLTQLSKHKRENIAALHGVGANAMQKIQVALQEIGLSFKPK